MDENISAPLQVPIEPVPPQPQPSVPAPVTSPQPTVPTEPVVPQIPKSKSKLLLILLPIAIILLLSSLGIFVFQKYFSNSSNPLVTQPTPVSTSVLAPTPDVTANWKTYSSDKQQFSIKFPENWSTDDKTGVFIGLPGEVVLFPQEIPLSPFGPGIAIYSSGEKVMNRLPYLNDFSQAQKDVVSDGLSQRTFKISDVRVDGIGAVQYVNRALPGDGTGAFYAVITWLVHNNTNYYLEFWGSEDYIKSNLSIYNQILSTFKFTQ